MSRQANQIDHTLGSVTSSSDSIFSKPQYLLRGGIIGACVTAFISWNSRKVSKIGVFYRKWKLARNFIVPKRAPKYPPLTSYFLPPMNRVMNNFICYSGEPGIGKSYHFQNVAAEQSKIRPVLLIKFKSIGTGINFDTYVSQQIGLNGHVDEGHPMITQIKNINQKPQFFWLKYLLIQTFLVNAEIGIYMSNILDAAFGLCGLAAVVCIHLNFTRFLHPFIIQSIRRSIPLIIFDDVNKLDSLNMLPEVTRFLKIMQQNIGNVVLISSDEDTWAELRKQPGMKDRLRQKQIKYDHKQVTQKLGTFVQKNFTQFMKETGGHPVYTKQVVLGLIEYLIGLRQITLRRFSSILKLNDEQQYEKLLQILQNKQKASANQVVVRLADVFFQNEMENMVANLKNIKRSLRQISNQEFVNSLNILLKKLKLPSDDPLGPHLQLYSIVRQRRSEFVFNGRFMYTVYGMAVRQYINDIEEYQHLGIELNKEKPT